MNILTQREVKVLELRSQGLTLEQIGNIIGVTRQRVYQIEKEANFKIKNDTDFDINESKKKIKRLEFIERVLKGEYDFFIEKELENGK